MPGMAALLMRVQDAWAAHTQAMRRMQQRMTILSEELRGRRGEAAAGDVYKTRWAAAEALCARLRAEGDARAEEHAAAVGRHASEVARHAAESARLQDAVDSVQQQRDEAIGRLGDMQRALEDTQRALVERDAMSVDDKRALEAAHQDLEACRLQCSALRGRVAAEEARTAQSHVQLQQVMAWRAGLVRSAARLGAAWALLEDTAQQVRGGSLFVCATAHHHKALDYAPPTSNRQRVNRQRRRVSLSHWCRKRRRRHSCAVFVRAWRTCVGTLLPGRLAWRRSCRRWDAVVATHACTVLPRAGSPGPGDVQGRLCVPGGAYVRHASTSGNPAGAAAWCAVLAALDAGHGLRLVTIAQRDQARSESAQAVARFAATLDEQQRRHAQALAVQQQVRYEASYREVEVIERLQVMDDRLAAATAAAARGQAHALQALHDTHDAAMHTLRAELNDAHGAAMRAKAEALEAHAASERQAMQAAHMAALQQVAEEHARVLAGAREAAEQALDAARNEHQR